MSTCSASHLDKRLLVTPSLFRFTESLCSRSSKEGFYWPLLPERERERERESSLSLEKTVWKSIRTLPYAF
jgi:hypothetical protein